MSKSIKVLLSFKRKCIMGRTKIRKRSSTYHWYQFLILV